MPKRLNAEQNRQPTLFEMAEPSDRSSQSSNERPFSLPGILLGTSAFTADGWEGSFYPQGMRSRDFLSHYAQQFQTVEIDSTFYGTPSASTVANDWIEKNPCAGVRLPLAGSKVKRTILTPQQVAAIAARLEEPYSTLVIFLAATGLRIGEAVGIKWSDFEGDTVHIRRRIYERQEGTTKTKGSERSIPIPSALLERMKLLGEGEWVFRSRAGTPVDPKNAANRYLRPVAKELGIKLGGWHDFRHTLSTQLLKRYPTKVVSELLGHSSVQTTLSVYQHVQTEDFRAPLNEMATELLSDVIKSRLAAA